MQKIKEYIKAKTTITKYAELIGYTRQHLQHVLGGKYPISIRMAKKIIEESNNRFSLDDFF